ncbi:MAG: hypothetical protein GWO78_05065 [Dehalococcoidales bacterium]|nr:hypothetical protein [Dehalococcoidales bacterium]
MKIFNIFILIIFSFILISCGSSTSEQIETNNNSTEITTKSNDKIIQSVTPEPIATEITLKTSKRSSSSRNKSSASQIKSTPISITVLPTSSGANKSSPTDKSQSYNYKPTFVSTATPSIVTTLPTSVAIPISTIIPIPDPIPDLIPTPTPLPKPEKITTTESLCEDRKDYVYCTSSEAIVAPFTQLDWESGWGVEKGYSPEVFCASDLQETVCPAVTSSLLAAMIEWGSYEPVEYWVLGTEKEAASKLTNINCERRENRNQQSMDDCLGRHGPDSGGLDFYRRIGEEGIENNFGSASAAHMGHDEWGFHFFGSSIPFGFTDLFQPIEAGTDQRIFFHEYFHAIQSSHMGVGEKRTSLKGPDWFYEGGAEYMGQIKYQKAIDTNLLKPIYGSEPNVLRDNMEDKMLSALDKLSNNCPGSKLQDINYENSCDILYDLGTWALAYLAQVYGKDLLLESFYKNLTEKPNWEVAFKDTFGISLEKFYEDFDKFLKLQGSDYDLFHDILGNMEYRIF